jgi:polyisoprenoid-binding protein YceI
MATFNGGADNLLTGKYTLGFTATGSFKRSDYGMDSFAGIIGDEVNLEIFAEFLRN